MFSDRLQRRARLWWGQPHKWRNRDSYRHLVHRIKENHTLRRKTDPDDRWQCCALWQRTLSNKWNAREFAQKHGCRVPALYWYGRRVGGLPIDALPEHYVIRPVFGDSAHGVYVFSGAQELLRQTRYTQARLMTELKRARGRISRFPILVEEFVRTEAGEYRLPLSYKCHTFGDTIAAIEVVQASSTIDRAYGYYSPEWQRFADPMNINCPAGGDVGPPRCLEELLRYARTLGVAYGTYVRVDLYATDRGCVFGEFSTTPDAGSGFTPYAEHYFENLWRQTFPDCT